MSTATKPKVSSSCLQLASPASHGLVLGATDRNAQPESRISLGRCSSCRIPCGATILFLAIAHTLCVAGARFLPFCRPRSCAVHLW